MLELRVQRLDFHLRIVVSSVGLTDGPAGHTFNVALDPPTIQT
jgi:hypothetical protein